MFHSICLLIVLFICLSVPFFPRQTAGSRAQVMELCGGGELYDRWYDRGVFTEDEAIVAMRRNGTVWGRDVGKHGWKKTEQTCGFKPRCLLKICKKYVSMPFQSNQLHGKLENFSTNLVIFLYVVMFKFAMQLFAAFMQICKSRTPPTVAFDVLVELTKPCYGSNFQFVVEVYHWL